VLNGVRSVPRLMTFVGQKRRRKTGPDVVGQGRGNR
jgi:hypothetical protein